MATMSARRSGGWMFSVKLVIISSAVLSTAVVLKLSAPSIRGFVISDLPRIYSSLLSWLTPPYLYFVINGIIISIAACSRFQKAADGAEPVGSVAYHSQAKAPLEIAQEYVHVPQVVFEVSVVKAAEAETRTEYGISADQYDAAAELHGGVEVPKPVEEEEEFIISRSSWTPSRREQSEIPPEHSNLAEEKPLVSVRFPSRKSVKPSPEGKALGVARSKRNGTLENTWKTITDGRPIPLTRHLKKSDTFDVHVRGHQDPSPVRKSETLNERRRASASPSPGSSGGRLRKEPSLGQDELNRKVEAFINKFNEEMRLQRQESFQHYQEMVNRGSH